MQEVREAATTLQSACARLEVVYAHVHNFVSEPATHKQSLLQPFTLRFEKQCTETQALLSNTAAVAFTTMRAKSNFQQASASRSAFDVAVSTACRASLVQHTCRSICSTSMEAAAAHHCCSAVYTHCSSSAVSQLAVAAKLQAIETGQEHIRAHCGVHSVWGEVELSAAQMAGSPAPFTVAALQSSSTERQPSTQARALMISSVAHRTSESDAVTTPDADQVPGNAAVSEERTVRESGQGHQAHGASEWDEVKSPRSDELSGNAAIPEERAIKESSQAPEPSASHQALAKPGSTEHSVKQQHSSSWFSMHHSSELHSAPSPVHTPHQLQRSASAARAPTYTLASKEEDQNGSIGKHRKKKKKKSAGAELHEEQYSLATSMADVAPVAVWI